MRPHVPIATFLAATACAAATPAAPGPAPPPPTPAALGALLATAQAHAARNRANRLSSAAFTSQSALPNFTNTPDNLWPTSVTHGGPLADAILTLFHNRNRTAAALASRFLADALPTWYNNVSPSTIYPSHLSSLV